MAYEWLFFDADGTLFDYDAAEGVALQRAVLHDQVPEHAPRAVLDHLQESAHDADHDQDHRHAQADRRHGEKRRYLFHSVDR